MTTKKVLTTGEVGEWLGYSDQQIRRMCEAGTFGGDGGAYRSAVGAHWRIPSERVERFLADVRPKRR